MWPTTVACSIFFFAVFFQNTGEAKTYYFNQNKTTNEFLVYNRINLNNSQNNAYRPAPSELIKKTNVQNVTKNNKNESYQHELLDREWNYNWTNITRHKLPVYITKLYELTSLDMKAPSKILFNYLPINATMIKFNFSSFKERISDAELHFYHTIENNQLQKPLILRLYQVENQTELVKDSSLINPDSHKLLNVIYISQAESGWQVFKLNKIIKEWVSKWHDLSLFITISKPNDNKFTLFKDSNRNSTRTFLVLKLDSHDQELYQSRNYTRLPNSPCRRQMLYVDFEKLNWHKFIIAPKGFDAFTCTGKCFASENLTNHMKITSSQPGYNIKKSLCCVPTHYSALPIMFYNKYGNIEIKIYTDIIVSDCGCR